MLHGSNGSAWVIWISDSRHRRRSLHGHCWLLSNYILNVSQLTLSLSFRRCLLVSLRRWLGSCCSCRPLILCSRHTSYEVLIGLSCWCMLVLSVLSLPIGGLRVTMQSITLQKRGLRISVRMGRTVWVQACSGASSIVVLVVVVDGSSRIHLVNTRESLQVPNSVKLENLTLTQQEVVLVKVTNVPSFFLVNLIDHIWNRRFLLTKILS